MYVDIYLGTLIVICWMFCMNVKHFQNYNSLFSLICILKSFRVKIRRAIKHAGQFPQQRKMRMSSFDEHKCNVKCNLFNSVHQQIGGQAQHWYLQTIFNEHILNTGGRGRPSYAPCLGADHRVGQHLHSREESHLYAIQAPMQMIF